MRLLVKHTLAILLYYTGLLRLWELLKLWRGSKCAATILAYHCFLDNPDPLRKLLQPGLCMTPNHFDQQLAFFKQRYQLLSLDDYIDKLSAVKVLPKRSLIITIDDGWRDNYDHAFPILKEHKAPATIFLTTDYIDSNRQFWFLKVAHLIERTDLSHENFAAGLESLPELEVKTFTEGLSDSDRRLDRNRLFEKLKKLNLNSQRTVINLLERLAEPDQAIKDSLLRSTLTWDEVREMSKAGISFGSHGDIPFDEINNNINCIDLSIGSICT